MNERRLRRLRPEEHAEVLKASVLQDLISRFYPVEDIQDYEDYDEEIEEPVTRTLFRVVTHDRTAPNGEQWSDYWVESYPEDTDPLDSLSGSVVHSGIEDEREAEEYADKAYSDRIELMKKYYKE